MFRLWCPTFLQRFCERGACNSAPNGSCVLARVAHMYTFQRFPKQIQTFFLRVDHARSTRLSRAQDADVCQGVHKEANHRVGTSVAVRDPFSSPSMCRVFSSVFCRIRLIGYCFNCFCWYGYRSTNMLWHAPTVHHRRIIVPTFSTRKTSVKFTEKVD